jgi:two-component system chemotaxis response regulator CheB
MPGHDIIVVGASAGGVEALTQLVGALPKDLPATLFVVLHVPPNGPSLLPGILTRCGGPPAVHPHDGQAFQYGTIYVAPPDVHLLVKPGYVTLVHGPRENGHRPAIDPLFRTAARVYGPRVVGVVLSGSLDDGTAGLLAIKRRGGIGLAQDPGEAIYEGMPHNAIDNGVVDQVLPVAGLAAALVELAHRPVVGGGEPVPEDIDIEADSAELEMDALERYRRNGIVSSYTCPECHGALWEVQDGELVRFRCRVGHAFSVDTLLAEQSTALEEALWTAFRALEERAALARQVAARLRQRNNLLGAGRFDLQARDAEERATLIRRVLLKGEVGSPTEPTAAEEKAKAEQKAVEG